MLEGVWYIVTYLRVLFRLMWIGLVWFASLLCSIHCAFIETEFKTV
uniref:Transmembrane protein n=1 Tax=Medicago truncatula TaxID=3880 RepID=B7FJ96_MEDTR|nr:unknown [Medicago truncatula]